jgi:hypothetical protein
MDNKLPLKISNFKARAGNATIQVANQDYMSNKSDLCLEWFNQAYNNICSYKKVPKCHLQNYPKEECLLEWSNQNSGDRNRFQTSWYQPDNWNQDSFCSQENCYDVITKKTDQRAMPVYKKR